MTRSAPPVESPPGRTTMSLRGALAAKQSKFIEKNAMLVREFDRYIPEHPEFADRIPNNALIVVQIDGDEEFNKWAQKTAQRVAEKDNSIVYVIVTELKPVRSRIKRLKNERISFSS